MTTAKNDAADLAGSAVFARREASAGRQAAHWPARLRWVLCGVDALGVSAVLALTNFIAFREGSNAVTGADSLNHVHVSIALLVAWMILLAAHESRHTRFMGAGLEEYRRVMRASFQAFGILAVSSYLLRFDVSRLFFITTLPLGLFVLLAGRWVVRNALNLARAQGRTMIPAVVVGDETSVMRTLKELSRHKGAGYLPVAVSIVSTAGWTQEHMSLPSVPVERLASFIDRYPLAAVMLAGGQGAEGARRVAWELEGARAQLLMIPRLIDVAGPRMSVYGASGLNFIHVELPSFTGVKYWAKRLFDIVFSASVLVLLFPVLLVIAIAIKGADGGPVLFRQERVGLHGKPFVMHKFRSMHLDAESRLAELRANSIGDGPLFKMIDDPRVTPVGRFLRKYSLDELPQFWTVLRGDMSVVGPRPHLAHELTDFPRDALRRLLIKPGITGLWQIGGRSDLGVADAIALDLRYVENWSFLGDVSIILKTVRAVLVPHGAY